VVFSYLLRVELDRATPNHGVSEVFDHAPVDLITKVFNSRVFSRQDDWRCVVRISSFWLCIDSDQIEILPHSFNEFIEIPSKFTCNWHIMFNLIKNIEFVKCEGINFVKRIKTRNVLSVTFYNIDNIIFSSITLNANIGAVDPVLFEDGLNGLVAHSIRINHSGNCDTALVFFLEIDVWWALVQSDSKTFKFVFDDSLVLHWSC
jgi:hypothetical protein